MAQWRKDKHEYLNDSKTLFETVMLADKFGNLVGAANPSGMAVDAFGRARVSQPLTLFDSSHRYRDNGKISSSNSATGATIAHNANAGLIECTLDTTQGSFAKRESSRVFSYQPGKSLLILQSFVLASAKTGLRQRYGYFNEQNGVFLQLDGTELSFIERSFVSGSATETKITQANWNIDKMDGTGPSRQVLDISKAQILFIDIEWLGLGTVRCGFIIDGQFIHCHSFHHANIIDSTYITTAVLPVRLEIENTGTTASNSILKEVCATVISEGGYELRGRPRTIGQSPVGANQFNMATAGTFYPVQAIRLNPSNLDAVVVLKELSAMPISSGFYRLKLVTGADITGAVWANVASDSSVQFNTNTAAVLDSNTGTDIFSSYFNSTNQSASGISLGDSLFKYQLERNSFANTPLSFVIAVTSSGASANVVTSVTWEEVG
jgi:hypothetical protein